jgi:hypothetical protein
MRRVTTKAMRTGYLPSIFRNMKTNGKWLQARYRIVLSPHRVSARRVTCID